jgi:GR25 family glycosyltransferase involved in LPS biosynthesis
VTYTGFYINLDDSADRRAEIEAELARFGLQGRYRRFSGARGNVLGFSNPRLSDSEIGCFTSHYLLLKDSIDLGAHIHVLEDDVVLSRFTENALHWVIKSGTLDQFDVIFTDTFVTPLNLEYRYCKELYDRSVDYDDRGIIADVRLSVVKHIAGTSSYIVNRNSIPKLLGLCEQELKYGAAWPLDLTIRTWTDGAKLRTGALFPFTTSVRLDRTLNTTLPGRRQNDLTIAAAWLGRHSFFVERDISALRAEADRLLELPSGDPHHQLLAHILAFSLTNAFQEF